MKRIITILSCLLFLVAMLPGTAMQQLVDPITVSESGTSNETTNTTEEKQEEHFISFRNKLQNGQQPVIIQNRLSANRLNRSIPDETADAATHRPVHTSGTPLYLQYNSWLI